MISAFQGQSADNVWQQAAEGFRRSDGARSQNSRGGSTREILHVAISIADPRQRWVVSREPPLNIAFALAEVVWIMTGRRTWRSWNIGTADTATSLGPAQNFMAPTATAFVVILASTSLSGPSRYLYTIQTRDRWSCRFGIPNRLACP